LAITTAEEIAELMVYFQMQAEVAQPKEPSVKEQLHKVFGRPKNHANAT
jgi:hypothetical protein